MADKALEAAADAAIVAKAMACSEWPKWLFDLIELTNRAADEADMSTEQAVAFAVLSYLSALPGEAEVVAWLQECTAGPYKGDIDVHSLDGSVSKESERVSGFYSAPSPVVTLASYQAMQARAEQAEQANKALMDERTSLIETKRQQIEALSSRAEKAERERDEAYGRASAWAKEEGQRQTELGTTISRAEAAEARVKGLEPIVEAVAHIGVDFGYGPYVLEDKYIEAARTALTGDKL